MPEPIQQSAFGARNCDTALETGGWCPRCDKQVTDDLVSTPPSPQQAFEPCSVYDGVACDEAGGMANCVCFLRDENARLQAALDGAKEALDAMYEGHRP